MRIAIFTNNYLPNPYGVSMSIESFRSEFERLGHTVYIFAPKFKGYVDVNKNVFRYPAFDFKFSGIRFPLAVPFSHKIDRILENLEIDVIHSQHPNLLGWVAKRWSKKKNVPLVFTWHTLYDQYAHFVPVIPSSVSSWFSIGNAVRYANNANAVIVPTPSVKNIIQKWGVSSSDIYPVATGVDEKLYEKFDGDGIRDKYASAKNDILILLVSRLTKEKNICFLFEAMAPLLLENKKIKFLVVGEGGERAILENQVAASNLEDQVFFAGVVSADAIKNYYAAADIFVHASLSETQGMILTEAMYMGLPIVAVKAPGANDLVGNLVTGILVKESPQDFASAVLRLASDAELRRKFSENAKKSARENYTASICALKLLEIYQTSKIRQ